MEKIEIEEIIQGIGSPYGEGATYRKLNGYNKEVDGKVTHLDEGLAEAMRKDINALIATERRKAREDFVQRVKPLMNTVTDADTLDTFLRVILEEEDKHETKN